MSRDKKLGPAVFQRGYLVRQVLHTPAPPPPPCPLCGTPLNRHVDFLSCPNCEHCEPTVDAASAPQGSK